MSANQDRVHGIKQLLRVIFGVVPIAAGADKFFNFLTDWTQYINPMLERFLPVSPSVFMHAVGVIEIVAGIIVLSPFHGGWRLHRFGMARIDRAEPDCFRQVSRCRSARSGDEYGIVLTCGPEPGRIGTNRDCVPRTASAAECISSSTLRAPSDCYNVLLVWQRNSQGDL